MSGRERGTTATPDRMIDESLWTRKIDVRLRNIRTDLAALNWYATRYPAGAGGDVEADPNFDAFRYEWRDTLDRFEGAHKWFLASRMSEQQVEQHQTNLRCLLSRSRRCTNSNLQCRAGRSRQQ